MEESRCSKWLSNILADVVIGVDVGKINVELSMHSQI